MNLVADLLACLRFFSRLPLPASRSEPPSLTDAVAMVPVAGAIIGVLAAVVLLAVNAAGLPPLIVGTLSLAALVAITGALHEDGLADCADGFGGGATRERKLEIMRDSRIGTFGACALGLSLLVRAAALGAMARAPEAAAAGLLVAAIASRTAALLPLALLPPARPSGLGASAARPQASRLAAAIAIAVGLGLVASQFGPGATRTLATIALAFIGALAVCAIAWRQIGGQTGDVAGAAQQIGEIAALLVFAAGS